MRNVKVAVAFVLLALAGCGSTNTGTPPGSASSTAAATTSASSPASTTLSPPNETPPAPQTTAAPLAGGPTEVPAAQVDGGTLPESQRHVWTSEDGRTVQLVGRTGGCKTATAEVTAQSGDQVLITLVTTYYPPGDGGMCTQELRDVTVNATLDAPLGSRRIVLEAREDTA